MRIYFIVIVSLLFFGCSNKSIYNNVQLNNRQSCQKLPPSQYDECIKQTEKSYDEYERERNEILNK